MPLVLLPLAGEHQVYTACFICMVTRALVSPYIATTATCRQEAPGPYAVGMYIK